MESKYPSAIDTFPAGLPLGETTMNDSRVEHAELHRLTNNAVGALQATLGLNPAGGYSNVAARLAAASYIGHTHTISDVTGLQAILNGKAAVDHTHEIEDIPGLREFLDELPGQGHTHTIADVLGLQAALDETARLSTEDPEPLGAVARGSSNRAAREDHVHPLPSLPDLGAVARTTRVDAGPGLTGGGPLSGDVTLAADLSAPGAIKGSASTLARSDHNHDDRYPHVVSQTLGTAHPPASDYAPGTILIQY